METGRSVFLGQFFFLFVPRNSRRSARVEENARRGNSQNFKYFLRVTRVGGNRWKKVEQQSGRHIYFHLMIVIGAVLERVCA